MNLDTVVEASRRESCPVLESFYTQEEVDLSQYRSQPRFWSEERLPTLSENKGVTLPYVDTLKSSNSGTDGTTEEAGRWDTTVVLSLDGGGVRGLSELYFLKYLMEIIAVMEKTALKDPATASADSLLLRFHAPRTDIYSAGSRVLGMEGVFLPCHYFDFIGGTSTGGIIAIMLGRMRLSVDQTIKHFERMWTVMAAGMSLRDRVLPMRKAKATNSGNLDRALQEIIEDHSGRLKDFIEFTMSNPNSSAIKDRSWEKFALDPNLCKTCVLAMKVSPEGGLHRPYMFRSYPIKKGDSETSNFLISGSDGQEILIADACRATSAAPGYFKGVKINKLKYRDGAIWSANPAMEIYREIEESNLRASSPIELMVSIGCGRKKSTWGRSRSDREAFIVDEQLSKKLQSKYFRFDGPSNLFDLEANEWRIDGRGVKTFNRIRDSANAFCKQNAEKIESLARQLVAIRRQRSKMSHWEKFALGMQYVCRAQPSCGPAKKTFEDREEFIFHLLQEHNQAPPDSKNWDRVQELLVESQTTTVR